MKKADVTVGMTVVNRYGLTATVMAVGGWYPEMSTALRDTLTVDGVTYKVFGRRVPRTHGILLKYSDTEYLHVWQAKHLQPAAA